MATMNISLPDEMKAYIEARAEQEGFGTVSEYLRSIIREQQRRDAALATAHDRLRELVREALDEGPPEPVTEEDFAALRRAIREEADAASGGPGRDRRTTPRR
jgi:antitoxin ParD1/3/4